MLYSPLAFCCLCPITQGFRHGRVNTVNPQKSSEATNVCAKNKSDTVLSWLASRPQEAICSEGPYPRLGNRFTGNRFTCSKKKARKLFRSLKLLSNKKRSSNWKLPWESASYLRCFLLSSHTRDQGPRHRNWIGYGCSHVRFAAAFPPSSVFQDCCMSAAASIHLCVYLVLFCVHGSSHSFSQLKRSPKF